MEYFQDSILDASIKRRVGQDLETSRAAQGKPPLVAWRADPWEFLRWHDLPEPVPEPEITVAAMRRESRSGALNLTNCAEPAMTVLLGFDRFPGGATTGFVTVSEVAWTDTRQRAAVAQH